MVSSLRFPRIPQSRRYHVGEVLASIETGVAAPSLRIDRWGEVSLTCRLLHEAVGTTSVDQQAIVWHADGIEARLYALTLADGGGYEYAVHLDRRPASNVLRFALETNASLLYQSLVADRGHRPDWAKDSYAFYHPTAQGNYERCGGQNYRAGKVGHLHRACAVDAIGRQVWCAQTIARDVLTITVPQDFLDGALYPVLVDPTFGFTTQGGSDDDTGGTTLGVWVKAFTTPASSGSMDSLSMIGTGSGTAHFNPALYADSGSNPTTRLAFVNTGGVNVTTLTTYTQPLTYASITSGVQYWLGLQTDLSTLHWKYDALVGAAQYFDPMVNVWPDPATGGRTALDQKITIWVNYTVGGGGPVVVDRPHGMQRPFPFGPGSIPDRGGRF